MKYPPKHHDVSGKAKKLIESGEYVFTGHAKERLDQREVTVYEVRHVLKYGYRQPDRDRFDEKDQKGLPINRWSYVLQGPTLDEKKLRVVISFVENSDFSDLMLIVTVIDLNKGA